MRSPLSRVLVLVALAVGLAACGGGAPDKVEQLAGTDGACATDKTYPDYRPPSGCFCKSTWTYNGVMICESRCGIPDGDPNGPWCFTAASCNGQTWAYCTR